MQGYANYIIKRYPRSPSSAARHMYQYAIDTGVAITLAECRKMVASAYCNKIA